MTLAAAILTVAIASAEPAPKEPTFSVLEIVDCLVPLPLSQRLLEATDWLATASR
jgi:hypothetical protein